MTRTGKSGFPPWDVAGGLLVAEEAGCAIRWQRRETATGEETSLIVCGTEALADSLSSLIASIPCLSDQAR